MTLEAFPGTDPIKTPTTISGKGVWPEVLLPSDEDNRDATHQNVGPEALTERTNLIGQRCQLSVGATAAKSFQPTNPAAWIANTSMQWTTAVLGTEAGGANIHMIFTDVPDGVQITAITVRIDPANGHTGMPQTKPFLRAKLHDCVAGTITDLGSVEDSSANVTTYQAPHTLTLTLTPTIYDKSKHIIVARVEAEAGLDAASGFLTEPAVLHWDSGA